MIVKILNLVVPPFDRLAGELGEPVRGIQLRDAVQPSGRRGRRPTCTPKRATGRGVGLRER